MTRILKLAVPLAVALVAFATLFVSVSDTPRSEAGSEPRLQIVTISPIVAQAVFDLVADVSPLVNGVYDEDAMTSADACLLVYAIRVATGNQDDADRLDPDGNTVPCEGFFVPADEITLEDYEILAGLDADQVSENGNGVTDGLFILVLNRDPQGQPVQLDATDGRFWSVVGPSAFQDEGEHFTCSTAAHDPDCTTASPTLFRDSSVGVPFSGPLGGRGDITITASIPEDGDEASITLKGVGDPVEVTPLLNLDPKLEVGGTQVCRPNGEEFTFANLLQITTLAGLPDAGLVAVQAKDSDGTGLTGIPVEWKVEAGGEDILVPGFLNQFSLFNSGLLLGPNLMCSGTETGTATVEVRVRRGAGGTRSVAQSTTTLSWTVIGKPAQMVAYADPPTIDCNGVNTTTVNVHVLDANANNGVGGREVRYDLQVLGTANPIVGATNADGLSTSVVTPLAQEGTTGVPVIITGPIGLQATALVNCQVGAGTGVPGTGGPPPTGGGAGAGGQQPGGSITGPDTGSAGVAGRGSLPVWPAVALFVAAMALAGARYGLRRAA